MKNFIRKEYPSKTSLNLVINDKPKTSFAVTLLSILILTALIGAFSKFAVIDRFVAVERAESETETIKALLEKTKEANLDYEKIQTEYRQYVGSSAEEGKDIADRMQILSLIETYLIPNTKISNISIIDNVMTLNLSGVTLSDLSVIYEKLIAQPIVEKVIIYKAAQDTDESTSVNMTINLIRDNGGKS